MPSTGTGTTQKDVFKGSAAEPSLIQECAWKGASWKRNYPCLTKKQRTHLLAFSGKDSTLIALAASLSRAGTRNSRRRSAPKPPGAQMLARNERPFEIPRLAPGFMMQTGIASRDEFEFFR